MSGWHASAHARVHAHVARYVHAHYSSFVATVITYTLLLFPPFAAVAAIYRLKAVLSLQKMCDTLEGNTGGEEKRAWEEPYGP